MSDEITRKSMVSNVKRPLRSTKSEINGASIHEEYQMSDDISIVNNSQYEAEVVIIATDKNGKIVHEEKQKLKSHSMSEEVETSDVSYQGQLSTDQLHKISSVTVKFRGNEKRFEFESPGISESERVNVFISRDEGIDANKIVA